MSLQGRGFEVYRTSAFARQPSDPPAHWTDSLRSRDDALTSPSRSAHSIEHVGRHGPPSTRKMSDLIMGHSVRPKLRPTLNVEDEVEAEKPSVSQGVCLVVRSRHDKHLNIIELWQTDANSRKIISLPA